MKEYKILLVEDKAFTGLALQAELKKQGIKICGLVSSGKDAIASTLDNNPDIIIMDVHLGGEMSGIQAAQHIRTFNDCLIIFITGYSKDTISEQIKDIKNSKLVCKPFKTTDIIKLLDT